MDQQMWTKWFLFPKAYQYAISLAEDGDNFLEIGAFEGASTCYMANLIKESGKKINFFVVDPWSKKFGGGGVDSMIERYEDDDFYPVFEKNLKERQLFQYVIPMKMTSHESLQVLKDMNFKFIFLDGDHSEENVEWEINNYMPLLVSGGVMGGDDYHGGAGVKRAVDRLLNDRIFFSDDSYSSWMYGKR